MANHMEEVAKMLGVELGEEFEIVFPNEPTHYTKAIFTDDGFKVLESNIAGPSPWYVFCLIGLLQGSFTIKRKPWKPKDRKIYWCVTALEGTIVANEWHNNWMDITYYKLGNCYRSREEAAANRDRWVAFYESDEVLEV